MRFVAFGFWLFAYVWLGLAPLAMLATDTYPLEYRTDEANAFSATVLIEVGLLAYSAGVLLIARRNGKRSVVLEPLLARRLAPLPVLVLCGLSLLLAVVLIPRMGGMDAFFTSRQALWQSEAATGTERTLRTWILAVPAFWALIGLIHLPRRPRGDRWLRSARWMLLPLLLGLNVVVNNPISRPRFWAGTVLLALLFSWSRFNRPRAFRITAAALTAVVLLVFPYSDYFRYSQREAVQVVSLTEQLTSNMDYDSFQQMQTGVDHVEENGFSPSGALGPFVFMVPRSLWPEKPQALGITLAQHAGYEFWNLSAPLWIESYTWAGFPAVVAVFGLLGAAGRRMDEIRERLRDGPATLAFLLVPAFAFYQLIFLRGSLLAIVGPMLLLLITPLFITRPAGRPPRFPSPAPPATASHALTPEQEASVTSSTSFDDRYGEPDQLRDQLRQLLQYRVTIALGIALGLLGALLLMQLRAGSYTSTGEVLVRSTVDPFSTYGVSLDNQVSMGTEQQIALSATVADRAAGALREPSRADALLKELRVSNPPHTQILRFEYTAGTSKRAARVTNAFVDAYLADRKERTDATVARMTSMLKRQVAPLIKKNTAEGGKGSPALREQINALQKRISDFESRDTTGGDVVRKAEPPKHPVGPGRVTLMGLGLMSGLVLAMVIAWLRSTLEPRIRSVGEVEGALGAPVLAIIPGTAADGELLEVGRVASSRAEWYRTLAFHLRHGDARTAGSTLLVVAPKQDHDAEAAAVNLAAAFAEFGEDVLLVDATARTPGLAARLPLLTEDPGDDEEALGLLDDRLVVDVGTAGRITLCPDRRGTTTGDIPMSPMVTSAVSSAGPGRSKVVVTRALLEHADGLAVAQRADGVLVVGGLEHTRRDDLRQVRELMTCSGGRIVGAVLCTGTRRSLRRDAPDGVRHPGGPGSGVMPAARADGAQGLSVAARHADGETQADPVTLSQRSSSAQDDTLTASKG
ncbi:hypothetical protein ACFQ6S_40320 [Streptomyces sp. NPDC056479]|uniref:hypothetical protein n=1 Tax=Streptomyces sp. NPDC056479 TaxID=3345832 RepID=UPI0036D1F310